MSRTSDFLEILQSGRHITIDEAMKELKSTKSGIYTIANTLRSKGNKIKTKRTDKGCEYFLSSPDITQKSAKNVLGFSGLLDQDKQDYFDMIKKSCFYKLCAEALIEAEKQARKICTKS